MNITKLLIGPQNMIMYLTNDTHFAKYDLLYNLFNLIREDSYFHEIGKSKLFWIIHEDIHGNVNYLHPPFYYSRVFPMTFKTYWAEVNTENNNWYNTCYLQDEENYYTVFIMSLEEMYDPDEDNYETDEDIFED